MRNKMFNFAKKVLHSIQETQQRRADFYILKSMSNKELKDIGITRSEIRQRIYGS
jgi:uncharacterized protein YjiS (DUF1127 family)